METQLEMMLHFDNQVIYLKAWKYVMIDKKTSRPLSVELKMLHEGPPYTHRHEEEDSISERMQTKRGIHTN